MSTAAAPVDTHSTPPVNLTKFGMITFLASEAMLFAGLISAYLILWISRGNHYVPANLKEDHFTWPILTTGINTIILVASSFTLLKAEKAVLQAKSIVPWLALTTLLGAIFVGVQYREWWALHSEHVWWDQSKALDASGHPISTTFNSSFFALTGFHGLHVTIGVIFLAFTTLFAALGRFTPHRHDFLTCVSLYWHFVDVVWLGLFTVMYIVPWFYR